MGHEEQSIRTVFSGATYDTCHNNTTFRGRVDPDLPMATGQYPGTAHYIMYLLQKYVRVKFVNYKISVNSQVLRS